MDDTHICTCVTYTHIDTYVRICNTCTEISEIHYIMYIYTWKLHIKYICTYYIYTYIRIRRTHLFKIKIKLYYIYVCTFERFWFPIGL